MKPKPFGEMRCSIARSLDHVGSWWSLLIIRDAMLGSRRFGEFQRSLGIAKNTLSVRLSQLTESGIMRKVRPADGSAHEEYELTEKGTDLAPVLITLAQWGDKWSPHQLGPSFRFIDPDTGDEINRVLPRRADGRPLPFNEITLAAGEKDHSL